MLRAIFGRDLERMSAELGGNPFDVVTKEQGAEPAVRLQVPLAHQARRRAHRAAPPGAGRALRLLAMLMSARDKDSGEPMAERQLIDEVLTLVVAGHETDGERLNWTWYLLSSIPTPRPRLHAELDASRSARAEPAADGAAGLHPTGRQ